MGKFKKTKLLLITLAVLAALLYFGPLLQWAANPLTVKDPLQKTDAIVILSGGLNPDGSLAASTIERMDHGLNLFQDGYAKRIILSGGGLQPDQKESQVMYDYALSKGFPADVFILDQFSTSTYENILFTSKIAADKNYKSLIMVTSPYHSARAKKMFAGRGIQVISSPAEKSELYTAKGQDKIRMIKLVAEEYLKIGIYQISPH